MPGFAARLPLQKTCSIKYGKPASLKNLADEDYGRRVEEGLKKANAENTSSREPMGAEGVEDAPRKAEEKGHSQDAY